MHREVIQKQVNLFPVPPPHRNAPGSQDGHENPAGATTRQAIEECNFGTIAFGSGLAYGVGRAGVRNRNLDRWGQGSEVHNKAPC
jgi:hypothetical protein